MTEADLDSLGFRVLEDEEDDDCGIRWDWGSYTYERPDGSRQYFPILRYNTQTKMVFCNAMEFSRKVENYKTMLEIIDATSFLMTQYV